MNAPVGMDRGIFLGVLYTHPMGELAETIDGVPVRLDEVGVVKAIERRWGSMEQLAHWLMVEEPHLIDAEPDAIAAQAGLPKDVMRYLLNSSKQFLKLLDWHVANQSFSLKDRAGAYRLIRQRMTDPSERLGDVIRAQEYLDRKTGTPAVVENQGAERPQVNVQIYQEGNASDWETDYSPLQFGRGAVSTRGGGSPSRSETIDLGERREPKESEAS